MIDLTQRNRLSQSGNPTSSINANVGDDVYRLRKIKMVDPSQAQRTRGGYGRKYCEELPSPLDIDGFRFCDFSAIEDSPIYGEGTIWDLVPVIVRSTMYPYQRNNIKELYNTLCVVSLKFTGDLEQKWASLSISINKDARALEELRDIISPLVHKCSENVKKTKAYSEGISLVGASRVVLLDVLWNPSVEQQATNRAYKNGQKKIMHVYCLVTSKWEVAKIEQHTRNH
ncbi:putative receptor-like protein 12-like [Capsicum annuum]|uniref:Uncharacterized protein n=1 Tax=Capsicum annuum TaxID=4072 RepID=A0A2G3AHQ0_CAPAN|nr:putative receptor-like protein 12-like [Capsicum annuum]KAF3668950.1 putative receptor-like protein 12-like [Capsicum annuum]PHT93693.1 hypothetical protein T459_01575 [Capsicum annuum]